MANVIQKRTNLYVRYILSLCKMCLCIGRIIEENTASGNNLHFGDKGSRYGRIVKRHRGQYFSPHSGT